MSYQAIVSIPVSFQTVSIKVFKTSILNPPLSIQTGPHCFDLHQAHSILIKNSILFQFFAFSATFMATFCFDCLSLSPKQMNHCYAPDFYNWKAKHSSQKPCFPHHHRTTSKRQLLSLHVLVASCDFFQLTFQPTLLKQANRSLLKPLKTNFFLLPEA